MECHINVLDFTPGPKSQCSVNSNRLVKLFVNSFRVTALFILFYFKFDIRFVFELHITVLRLIGFVVLYDSHPEHADADEKWRKQLHTSEPVVAIASHPTNDYLLAGTQVFCYYILAVFINSWS